MASFLDFLFGKKETSAQIAKGRLLFTIAHERANRDLPDYFVRLQSDLIQLISRYVKTSSDEVQIQRTRQDNAEILNIVLPEFSDRTTLTPTPSTSGDNSLFSGWFSKKPKTASIAKERLLIMIARDENGQEPDFFPQLQREITRLIAGHLAIDPITIKMQREHQDRCEILNIMLPEDSA